MKKSVLSIISLILCISVLFALSIGSTGAVTLYTDGIYTFADIDEDYVSLYSYDESTPTLVVPDMYRTRYVSSVYDYAFEGNETITSIDFSQCRKLDRIGLKAFASCSNLSGKLTLPNSVRTIALGAFEKCTSITEAVINSSVQTIPQQCFNRCSSLSKVYLPPNVESIENLAFANCGYLDDVYFPTSVNYISDTAFLNSKYVCFHVWYGSYAHQYAIDNNIKYILLDEVLLGDANGDGDVNVSDVTYIQSYLAELESLEGIYLHSADVNEDNEIDISDATAIQMYVAEFQIGHPIGQVMTK